jgi:hypothetical protein
MGFKYTKMEACELDLCGSRQRPSARKQYRKLRQKAQEGKKENKGKKGSYFCLNFLECCEPLLPSTAAQNGPIIQGLDGILIRNTDGVLTAK